MGVHHQAETAYCILVSGLKPYLIPLHSSPGSWANVQMWHPRLLVGEWQSRDFILASSHLPIPSHGLVCVHCEALGSAEDLFLFTS